jgi:membrane associated rhomboid family serine protease|nr:MAG: hypothetical protein DIU54_00100 [Acidobacteriota bacterium]
MLPVQDVMPSRSTPWITGTLVVLLTVVLAGEVLLPEPAARALILSYGLTPAHLDWATLVPSMFLHRSIVDFSFNALAIWVFGDNVEDRLGRGRYLVLLFAAGSFAGLLLARLVPDIAQPLVGAGGLAGVLIGAHLALFPRSQILMLTPTWRGVDLIELPALLIALLWLTMAGLAGGAWAPGLVPVTLLHELCGVAVGIPGARLLVRRDRMRCEWWNVPVGRHSPDRRRTSRDTSASSVNSASS